MAHIVAAEIELNPSGWMDHIPSTGSFTVDDGLRAIDIVLSETREALQRIGAKPTAAWTDTAKRLLVLEKTLEDATAQNVHLLSPAVAGRRRALVIELGLSLFSETQAIVDSWRGHVSEVQAGISQTKRQLETGLFFDLPVLLVAGCWAICG